MAFPFRPRWTGNGPHPLLVIPAKAGIAFRRKENRRVGVEARLKSTRVAQDVVRAKVLQCTHARSLEDGPKRGAKVGTGLKTSPY